MSKKTVKNWWGLEKGPMLNRYLNAAAGSGRIAEVTVRGQKGKGVSALRVMDSDDGV